MSGFSTGRQHDDRLGKPHRLTDHRFHSHRAHGDGGRAVRHLGILDEPTVRRRPPNMAVTQLPRSGKP